MKRVFIAVFTIALAACTSCGDLIDTVLKPWYDKQEPEDQ